MTREGDLANNEGEISMRYRVVSVLMIVLLTAGVSGPAGGEEGSACDDWRQSASETMSRVAGAQSRTEEALPILQDLIRRLDAGEAAAPKAFERERQRLGPTVEEAVTASKVAIQQAKRLKQLLDNAGRRCPEIERHGMKWAHWWFENHGPIVMMRAGYLAAVRKDFLRAESIFGEVIALAGNSENPNYAGLADRAKRSLEIVKAGKMPFIPRERKYSKPHNPGKVPPPEYVPKPTGEKP